jgi:hypothetical protein
MQSQIDNGSMSENPDYQYLGGDEEYVEQPIAAAVNSEDEATAAI